MIKALVSDFSRTLIFPKDESYEGGLNTLHASLKDQADYDVWQHFVMNDELLTFYQSLLPEQKLFVLTTRYIQEWPEIAESIDGVFTKIFSIDQMGWPNKTTTELYQIVAEELGFDPAEIIYVDDLEKNVQAAASAGMRVVKFESIQDVVEKIQQLIAQAS